MKHVLTGLCAGIVIGILIMQILPLLSKPSLATQLEAMLAAEGQPGHVVAIIQNGSLYKAIVERPNGLAEYWLTQDGRLVQSPLYVSAYTQWLTTRNAFLTCLKSKNVIFYGSVQTSEEARNATLFQVSVLGGWQGLEGIYQSCDANLSVCLDAGITQVPFWVFGEQNWTGVKSAEEIANLTGCGI